MEGEIQKTPGKQEKRLCRPSWRPVLRGRHTSHWHISLDLKHCPELLKIEWENPGIRIP